MSKNRAWARAHAEQVHRCAKDNFVEGGRGIVEVTLSENEATLAYIPAADLLQRGVGKFEIGLRAMVAAYDPLTNDTLVIRRGAEVMGCGVLNEGRLTCWCRPSDSLLCD